MILCRVVFMTFVYSSHNVDINLTDEVVVNIETEDVTNKIDWLTFVYNTYITLTLLLLFGI